MNIGKAIFTVTVCVIISELAMSIVSAATVPAGTMLIVRTIDTLSSSDSPGKRFAGKLDAGLTSKGQVVAPAGTTVYGRVNASQSAGRAFGRSTLSVSLTEISINGKLVRISTSSSMHSGASSGQKTAGAAGAGALIGAAFDGRSGAAKGAAIGAGASLLSKGEVMTVPKGTLLDFQLAAPVSL